ncbi:heparanase-like isoform X3 [Orbicella faveolata]|uniref:heparanase-like isoform X3 n=1 Tax=Orbicella faveolata TaxID=48498 RepID=UPI0009E39356|nr:heparanase-like isoform X3 [Orbicella faveolata]
MAPQVNIFAGSLIVLMMLFCGYPVLLQSHYVGFSKDNYVAQNVSINLDRSVFTVSEKFLSVAIDSNIMRHHWPHVNFTSERLFNLARGLSPAFLRIGGTAGDFLIYDDSQGLQKPKNVSNFTITHQDLDKIHLLSSKAGWDVMFGLNVLLRTQDGSWDASNPKEIMQYVAEHGYNFGWELGNEPNLFVDFGKSVSPEELAEDFHTLRAILQSSPQFGNYLVGPDVTTVSNHSKSANFFESFVSHAKDVIDAVTWHQ